MFQEHSAHRLHGDGLFVVDPEEMGIKLVDSFDLAQMLRNFRMVEHPTGFSFGYHVHLVWDKNKQHCITNLNKYWDNHTRATSSKVSNIQLALKCL